MIYYYLAPKLISMNRKGVEKFFLMVLLSLLSTKNYAQSKNWNIGFIAGLSNYQGDLIKEDFSLKAMHPSFGFEANYDFNRKYSIRSMIFYGRFGGSDYYYEDRKARGFSSETTFLELACSAQVNPLSFFSKRKYKLTPKVFVGGGLITYEVITWNVPENFHGAPIKHNLINPTFHFGANIFYKINEKYSIGYEMSHRSLLNDKIDGISIGNPKSYDWYYLSNFIITLKM